MSFTLAGLDCVLCGRSIRGIPVWRSQHWLVVACSRCGLLRTWPEPDLDYLRRLYETRGYHESRTVGWDSPEQWRARAEAVVRQFPDQPGTVLDFGAGYGHLVRVLREKAITADGVELSACARDAAHARHGIELHEAIAPCWVDRFDAVVLLHSLEHVANPVATLREIRPTIRAHGHLLIEVPHARSIEMCRRGRRTQVLDLPYHVHHFTPRTLTNVLTRAGYERRAVGLFNPAIVERLLEVRARRRYETPTDHGRADAAAPAGVGGGSGLSRSFWAEAGLSAFRRALPGAKFQIIARVD